MAISESQLVWLLAGDQPIPAATLHAIFGPGRVNGATETVVIYARNDHPSLTLTAVKLWTGQDAAGGGFSVALAAQPYLNNSGSINVDTLSYSTATTKAAGIAVNDVPPGYRAAVAVRRTLTGAGTAYPEHNRVILGGTSPI